MTHTPTPWEKVGGTVYALNDWGVNQFSCHVQPGHVGTHERTSDAECIANAAFIVRAVNSHDKLVEAIKSLLAHWDGDGTGKERRGTFEGVEYWSPAGRMVDTDYIVALRAALEGLE